MEDIRKLKRSELEEWLRKLDEPAYRAGQIYEWLHKKRIGELSEMTNIPKKLRERLSEDFYITRLSIEEVQYSKQDGTRKYLFGLSDGNVIEAVLMPYRFGNSVCRSSQVGCRLGCRFYASTMGGLVRNLSAAEMLSEVYAIEEDTGERVSHVVLMGTGEPLDNFQEVVRFIELISDKEGADLSQRSITLSTCGIVPRIYELAELGLKITLALSLHAATQEKRLLTMPVAEAYKLSSVLEACRYYAERTGRRLTLEYAVVKDVNDSSEDARLLSELARSLHAHINLIPVNPVEGCVYKEPPKKRLQEFYSELTKRGANATIRRELGRDIDSACGQLRRRYIKNAGICAD